MLNAEDIVLLERKWFVYKFKSKLKLILFFIIIILMIAGSILFFIHSKSISKVQKQVPQIESKKIEKPKNSSEYKSIPLIKNNEKNITTKTNIFKSDSENNATTIASIPQNKKLDIKNTPLKQKKQKTKKPYFFQLNPTLKNNDLFSSSGVLKFNKPFSHNKESQISSPTTNKKPIDINKKEAISISTTKIDTITYLKDKYASSGNIVFAIMLCEELYNLHRYDESLRWALSANEIDPTNEKSWYWFAKNKVALGEKKDAIKAIRTFLKNHSSRRLKKLLKEITQTKG